MTIKEISKETFSHKRLWFTNYINKNMYSGSVIDQNTTLIINRDQILVESFNQFATTGDLDLKKGMQIFFIDEVAQDTGGVYREWYTNLFSEIFSEEQQFFKQIINKKYGRQTYFFADSLPIHHELEYQEYYSFIGKILAKAIFDKIILQIDLNLIILKKILDLPICLNDIKFLDYQVSNI